ncbi:hypothetical protein I312_101231 [Cryptococcus bacillisporus CA1280]|uniref:uncharacterized protein n=1 Tax=Cryptococcus bacillisporus CA1280 TaxID=1296109 RepID=UPI003367D353
MLPDIATKMYNDLCSLHSGASEPLTGKNKTRSRPWMDALSELRFAVSNLQSSAWNIDPDILGDIEQKADGFFTELTERQEGPISEGHMAALTKRDLDDPTYRPPPQRFRLTRLNELESYMEANRSEVTQMMANIGRDWKDISGANVKWSEVMIPAISRPSESLFVSDPVNMVKLTFFVNLNDSTVAPDGLDSVLVSRAAPNYFTLRALLARHNEPPATNKKESRASATSVQKDREEAKKWEKNVVEWHASRRTSESIDVSNDDKTSQQLDKVATQIEAATVSDTPTIAPQLTEREKLFIANGLEPQEHFDWFEEVQEHLPLPDSTATTSQTSCRTGGTSASAISKPSRDNSLPKVGRLEEIRKLRSWR